MSILIRWRRIEKERNIGLQQIGVYRKKIHVCLRLYNFVLKSSGGFGGGEESFQKIACRRMNF